MLIYVIYHRYITIKSRGLTMLKKITLLFIFVFVFSLFPKDPKWDEGYSITEEEIAKIRQTTWEIKIKSNVKNAYMENIQFAIFDKDPILLLKANKERRDKINSGKKLTKLDEELNRRVDWDFIFSEISGHHVYLVRSKTNKNDNFNIVANMPGEKKWFVTKIVDKKDGRFSAWIIPFDSTFGETVEIEINEANSFDMKKIWQ